MTALVRLAAVVCIMAAGAATLAAGAFYAGLTVIVADDNAALLLALVAACLLGLASLMIHVTGGWGEADVDAELVRRFRREAAAADIAAARARAEDRRSDVLAYNVQRQTWDQAANELEAARG